MHQSFILLGYNRPLLRYKWGKWNQTEPETNMAQNTHAPSRLRVLCKEEHLRRILVTWWENSYQPKRCVLYFHSYRDCVSSHVYNLFLLFLILLFHCMYVPRGRIFTTVNQAAIRNLRCNNFISWETQCYLSKYDIFLNSRFNHW